MNVLVDLRILTLWEYTPERNINCAAHFFIKFFTSKQRVWRWRALAIEHWRIFILARHCRKATPWLDPTSRTGDRSRSSVEWVESSKCWQQLTRYIGEFVVRGNIRRDRCRVELEDISRNDFRLFSRGLIATPARSPQRITTSVTERLFGGMDMATLNIQVFPDYRGICDLFSNITHPIRSLHSE